MGEEDEDERDEREVFNQPRQDSVFNRQMETQAMIDEDVSETDPTRIVPHREIETEDYELENEGEVDDAFEDENLEAQVAESFLLYCLINCSFDGMLLSCIFPSFPAFFLLSSPTPTGSQKCASGVYNLMSALLINSFFCDCIYSFMSLFSAFRQKPVNYAEMNEIIIPK